MPVSQSDLATPEETWCQSGQSQDRKKIVQQAHEMAWPLAGRCSCSVGEIPDYGTAGVSYVAVTQDSSLPRHHLSIHVSEIIQVGNSTRP